jgi:uncharacterized protein YjbI with pentapeptide repeats
MLINNREINIDNSLLTLSYFVLIIHFVVGANLKGCNMEDPAGSRAIMEGVNLKGLFLKKSLTKLLTEHT